MFFSDLMATFVISIFFCLVVEIPIATILSITRSMALTKKPKTEKKQIVPEEDLKPNGIDNPAMTTTEDERL